MERFSNFGETTLNGDINNAVTSVVVTDGSVFPALGSFRVVVDSEIMLCTARSTNTLTVTRAQESTAAASHSSGATIALALTSGAISQLESDVNGGSGDPCGFVNRSTSQISFVAGTRTFSVAVKSPAMSFVVWLGPASSYTYTTTQSVVISTTVGLHYCYFNSSGTLVESTTFPGIQVGVALVGFVYWDGSTGINLLDERHQVTMPIGVHAYLHKTVGTRYETGLATARLTTGTGASNTDAQIYVTGGTIWDEDIDCAITRSASPAVDFAQELGTTPSTPGQIPVYYRNGASGPWTKAAATTYPFSYGGASTRAAYNSVSGGTWSVSYLAANNSYAVYFIVATNSVTEPVISVMGQADYGTTLANAQAVQWGDLQLGDLPAVEMKPIAKLIVRSSNTAGNTPKSYVAQVTDLRNVTTLPAGSTTVTSHQSLSGTTLANSHPDTAISVDPTLLVSPLTGADTDVHLALATLAQNSGKRRFTQASHGLGSAGAIVPLYQSSADTYALAKSNSATTIGRCVGQIVDTNTIDLFSDGAYVTGGSGFTAGEYHYVSDATAGAWSTSAPTSSTSYDNPLFEATSTTAGYVRIMRPIAVGALSFTPVVQMTPNFRLTGTSGTAVTTADVANITTLYYCPYKGNKIALYYGGVWTMFSSAEVSLALGTLTGSREYNVYCYPSSSSTIALVLGSAYTAGGADAETTTQDGMRVKSGDTSQLLVGRIYTTSTTQTQDTAAQRLVSNLYNQVPRKLKYTTTGSLAYTSASWRSANNSASSKVDICTVEALTVTLEAMMMTTGSSKAARTGIGLDVTNANSADLTYGYVLSGQDGFSKASYVATLSGYHALNWLEFGDTGVTMYYSYTLGNGTDQSGLVGTVMG